ncbi:hypothetical protein GOC74_00240 [Halomicrobium mukohataei]|uniref:Carbamoyltransferase n=1 Tax=Halomicrobium mukohataei TaxID=57705 RepID=A0A847U5T6_9EURY|nr:carbamoyltransferase C-terminal domain-containing protein [Halomicrobium mukohataei]NLV08369.1 hypothetical protein [Halomicrobium mukohataei]
MTTVLGIGDPAHGTGAALIRDGEVIHAVNESRLSRVKRESRFPASSVNYILEQIEEVPDDIAVSGIESPYFFRNLRYSSRHAKGLSGLLDAVASDVYRGIKQWRRGTLKEVAEELHASTYLDASLSYVQSKLTYVDHHRAHAASAYYTGPFSDATVLTVDAAGDRFSATVYAGEDGSLTRLETSDDIDSIGKLWAQVPTVFGFKGEKHAGKFMGMASYAETIPDRLSRLFAEWLNVDGLTLRNDFEREYQDCDYEGHVMALKEHLEEYRPSQVARALQDRTETILREYVENAVAETGLAHVVLAGGVFANVKVNQRIYESPEIEGVFVHQNMGDGGIGLGAALAMYADEHPDFTPTYLDDVYLGPKYGDEAIERAIDRVEIPDEYVIKQFDDESAAAETVADLLVDGHVVSLYTGQVEYGPRALGNRSILYQPTDPSAIEWLNQRLDRTEFMPFAPVTLKERADECYLDYDPDRCPAADFMTVSFDCTETMQDRSPGVVHVDGTARPQLIDEATNPLYYEILAAYEERTGIPSLINTSFNMHGEPIVCKPTEAIRSFLSTENEGLLMDQTLLRKGDQ